MTLRALPGTTRALAAALVIVLSAIIGAVPAHADEPQREAADPATELAERYAPYVAIQQQDEQCGPGEAFQPADVSMILDQPDVVLRDADGRLITTAPSAADLFNAPEGSNFDLPGSTLRPGCDYDRRFGWRAGGPPTVYARIVNDPEAPDRLVLQYWLYFVYNDWNNVHESDWEMAQIVFDAATPQAALDAGPAMMTLSQHYGNERRAWDDVQRIGDRPVIYPAQGSHAIFYSPRLWLGMSGDAGFGCDDSRGPSMQLDPAVVLMPEQSAITADGGFGWLAFKGHWGERQRSINDSELGPQYTRQWDRPIAYMDSGRDGAVEVPQVDLGVTRFFCSATKNVSRAINHMLVHPWILLAIILGIVLAIVLLVRATRWRPASAAPVVARRRAGQILSASFHIVGRNARRFVPVAVLATIGGIIGAIIQPALLDHTFLGDFVGSSDRNGATGVASALAAGAIETIPVMILALVVGVGIAHELDGAPQDHAVRRAISGRGLLPMVVVFLALILTGPFALLLVPALVMAPPAGTAEGTGLTASLRRSWALTRGHRLRTMALTAVAFAGALLLAPLIGIVTLLVIGKAFTVVNVIAGVVNAITLPWLATVLYVMYADLALQADG